MSYLTQDAIASSPAMQHRVAQCAAQEGVGTNPSPGDPVTGRPMDPDRWTLEHRRQWASAPDWDDAWEYALNTHPPVEGEPAYDPGTDDAVITDGQILGQVQSMLQVEGVIP
jgi:hypothetical protein